MKKFLFIFVVGSLAVFFATSSFSSSGFSSNSGEVIKSKNNPADVTNCQANWSSAGDYEGCTVTVGETSVNYTAAECSISKCLTCSC